MHDSIFLFSAANIEERKKKKRRESFALMID